MIIEAQKSNTELIGDIKEFKTGIDPKNLEFITTLLSTNLYSSPEQSFIREIVSNAWDSHVEANNTDTPVIIKMDDDNRNITIRDFGVGLSPERFEKIYCNIGSSTKRESNDFIGGFGIGRFSALACSNIVYITSYYKGKAYYYIMTKDGNTITTNLVATLDTDEKDGVEVTLKNLNSFNNYYLALDYIIFFPNIYVDSKGSYREYINNSKVKYYNNFAVSTIRIRHKILLGNVLYPLDTSQLDDDTYNFIKRISDVGIVIRFKVGELNITPNRESIIYSNETKKIINERIREAKNEINSIVKSSVYSDYDCIYNYYIDIYADFYYNFFSDNKKYEKNTISINHCGFYRFNFKLLNITPTYKGENLNGYFNIISSSLSLSIPEIRGNIIGSKFRSVTLSRRITNNTVAINSNQKLSSYVKRFIESKFDNCVIRNELSFDDFKEMYAEAFKLKLDMPDDFLIICKACYDWLEKNTTHIDFTNNKEFLDFKEEMQKNKVSINPIRDVLLYIYKNRDKSIRRFDNLEKAVQFIKRIKKGVVFGNIIDNEDSIDLLSIKYIYITANKKVLEELRKLNFTNIVSKEKATNRLEKIIRIAKPIFNHFNSYSSDLYKYRDIFNNEISKYCYIIRNKREELDAYNTMSVRTYNIESDPYYEFISQKVLSHIIAINKIISDYDLYRYNLSSSIQIVNCIAMKEKIFRVNYPTYKEMKSNKILKVLCKK